MLNHRQRALAREGSQNDGSDVPSYPSGEFPEIETPEFFALLASLDGAEMEIDLLAAEIADHHMAACTDSSEIRDAAWWPNENNEVATTCSARSMFTLAVCETTPLTS